MPRTALDRAQRLLAAGRYAETIGLLEPLVPVYRESYRFYYYLGSACLRNADSSGAYAYLKRAEQLNPSHRDTLLALAALYIRRGETDKAAELYLHVLELKPDERLAKKALRILRKTADPELRAEFVESGALTKLYPRYADLSRLLVPLLVTICVVAAALIVIPLGLRLSSRWFGPKAPRPEVDAVTLSAAERAAPVSTDGSFRYVLTEKQALAAFDRAKAYFQDYRDNAALMEINKLLLSNASASVKAKSKSLKAFVGLPDFRTIRDAPAYAEVSRDPALYDGCSVVWKGMAANLRESGAERNFDFLVGYENKSKLEGIIPARARGMIIALDRPLELLGTIRVEADRPRLDCIAVHELLGGSQ